MANATDRERSAPVDGVLLLNKPAGLTSNRALQHVKRLLRATKAGHTGALDPAATGMLPLCFGEATKVCPYLLDADKAYRVTASLGIATNMGDADGNETARARVPELTPDRWNAILQDFRGVSQQVPPMYSALKKDGKRLYELARQGKTVERAPREIRIDRIELLEIAGARLVFGVACSKGTYIRVLVEDIAAEAGTIAHTARLHRQSVGGFPETSMVELATLEAEAERSPDLLHKRLITPDAALVELPRVRVSAAVGQRFCAGQAVSSPTTADAGLVRVYAEAERFIGVGELGNNGRLAPRRVFLMGEKNL